MNEVITHNIRQIDYTSSVTLFIICALALLAFIKYNFGKSILYEIQSLFNYRQALRTYDERRESDRQSDILTGILFTLIAGIFVSTALSFFGASPLWQSHTLTILFFTLIIGAIYVIKALIWNILGIIFMAQAFSKIYIYNMFLFNRITGLIILPFVAIIPYIASIIKPYLIFSVIFIFILSYLLKLWRIIQIIHAQNVSIIYFILYLCALEILPLLILIKACMLLNINIFV